jgi:hypothetical protein
LNSSPRGESYSESYGSHDIIGCGINYHKQVIFFTKNGKYLGIAFKKISGIYYATVGLHSYGELIRINFGQSFFKFDVQNMIDEEKRNIIIQIDKTFVHVNDINSIIESFLLYYGYKDTLENFHTIFPNKNSNGNYNQNTSSNNSAINDQNIVNSLSNRKSIIFVQYSFFF